MADIATTDITYSPLGHNLDRKEAGMRKRVFLVSFGDGALTYPSGGVPLEKAKLGVPNEIVDFNLGDHSSGDGFLYKFDVINEKIRIYQGDNNNASDSPLIELVDGVATPAATNIIMTVQGW